LATISEGCVLNRCLSRLLTVLAMLAAWVPAQGADFTACVDPDPPPWAFWVRDAQGRKTGQLDGFSIELIQRAFARIGKSVSIEGEYPWPRCMGLVEQGQIDFAMDGYYSEARAKRFAYSAHFSTLTPQVYYRSGADVRIRTKADLKRYRGCGMTGASYAHYGLAPDDLDLGVTSHDVLVAKLLVGRCDYFVEELEVMAAFQMIGKDYLAGGKIAHGPVADAQGPSKYFMTALKGRGSAILPDLDRAIGELVASGDAERLWRRYAPNLPYRP